MLNKTLQKQRQTNEIIVIMTKKDISFNDAIAEVEAILKKIETGILDVDRLSESVKRASELIKICQKKLRDAEVEIGKIFTEPQKDQ